MATAQAMFRTDLYRLHLGAVGADMPEAESKREGAMHDAAPIAAGRGEVILGPDSFFDGHVFDPAVVD